MSLGWIISGQKCIQVEYLEEQRRKGKHHSNNIHYVLDYFALQCLASPPRGCDELCTNFPKGYNLWVWELFECDPPHETTLIPQLIDWLNGWAIVPPYTSICPREGTITYKHISHSYNVKVSKYYALPRLLSLIRLTLEFVSKTQVSLIQVICNELVTNLLGFKIFCWKDERYVHMW
jgi:hypothetical protein